MSKTYINVVLRQLVITRANGLCEYCLIHEDDTYFDGVRIDTLTEIGEVTARILDFNNVDRLIERQQLEALGRYPSPDRSK